MRQGRSIAVLPLSRPSSQDRLVPGRVACPTFYHIIVFAVIGMPMIIAERTTRCTDGTGKGLRCSLMDHHRVGIGTDEALACYSTVMLSSEAMRTVRETLSSRVPVPCTLTSMRFVTMCWARFPCSFTSWHHAVSFSRYGFIKSHKPCRPRSRPRVR